MLAACYFTRLDALAAPGFSFKCSFAGYILPADRLKSSFLQPRQTWLWWIAALLAELWLCPHNRLLTAEDEKQLWQRRGGRRLQPVQQQAAESIPEKPIGAESSHEAQTEGNIFVYSRRHDHRESSDSRIKPWAIQEYLPQSELKKTSLGLRWCHRYQCFTMHFNICMIYKHIRAIYSVLQTQCMGTHFSWWEIHI